MNNPGTWNPPAKTSPPPPPKLTVETKMVKCRVIEITGEYDYDSDDITKDISDWDKITQEQYDILCRFVRHWRKSGECHYIIARQIENIAPVLERTLKLAKAEIEKSDRREKTRVANTEKRAKTRASNQKKKELALLAELKAKHE